MLKNYSILIVLFLSFSVFGQTKTSDFLNKVQGIYKGELTIENARGTQKIPMEFHLNKTDDNSKFEYKLIYAGSPRNYNIIIKDDANGILDVDENNGIVLPTKYFNNTLYSFFEVQGNFLSSRLQFENEVLFFEILFTNKKDKITTGGTSDTIPEVFGFPITTIQKAKLVKQKN